jgi:hypothetical protein
MKELSVLQGPWSYTRASSCSLALYKERVLKMPPEPRPERIMSIDRTLFGSVLHLGASAILRCLVRQELTDDFPWSQGLRETAAAGRRPDIRALASELVAGASELAPLVGEVERRLLLFVNRFRADRESTSDETSSFITQRMIVCEHNLAVRANGSRCSYDECPPDGWRGKIDYAEDGGDGLLTVIDFKNRPAMYSDSELRSHEQLSLYLWFVSCHYPQFTKFRVGIYYFEFGATQFVDLSREEMLANVDRLRARAAFKTTLTAETLAAEPGFGKCQYCSYLMSCSAGNRVVEPSILVPTDLESAMATARWLVVNEERVSSAKLSLKAFTQEYGPLTLDDETSIGFSASEKTVYDKDATLRALKSLIDAGKIDGKLSQFTSLNMAEVKKAAKSEIVDKALESARSREMDTKFEVFRAKKRVAIKPGAKDTNNDRKVSGRVKSAARSRT